MLNFILNRMFLVCILGLVISLAVFVLMRSSGDPAELLLPIDASSEDVAMLRVEMGLDRSLWVQYFLFIKNVITGQLESFRLHGAVLPIVMTHLGRTLSLTLTALSIAFIFAVPLGTVAALHRGGTVDVVVLGLAVLGQSVPFFWLALLLIQLFAVRLRVLPVSGLGPWQNWVLPVTTAVSYNLAVFVRMMRSAVLDVLSEDYVTTARSKGLKEFVVLYKHVFRNAAIGVVTLLSIRLAEMLGGVIIIEVIFAWPGIGRLLYKAVLERDYPIVLATALVMAIAIGILNMTVDLMYGWIDPRIRIK